MPELSNPERIEEMRRQLQHIQHAQADNERRLAAGRRTTSPDGSVTITTGPGNAITDIQVTDHALRLNATQISRLLTDTARAATNLPSTPLAPAAEQKPQQHPRPDPDHDEPLSTVYD